ncbi:MAG: amidohydrolase family protein [Chloroflexi bacterium]|nr:amidohydrolase family protein [Chloroflexota bacterium]
MKLVLTADSLIDGTGAKPVKNGALVINNGRITRVTTVDKLERDSGKGVQTIHVKGGTIMPGFVEAHSHMHCSAEEEAYEHTMNDTDQVLLMRAVKAQREALLSGVTTTRDLGSKNNIAFPVKKAIEDGVIPGPRLLVVGTPITTTGGHCHMFGTEADTAEDVVAALRHQVKLGADYIKMMSTGGGFTPRTNVRRAQYPAETLAAAVKDAERMGVRVAAHCHGTEGVKNCVKAGIHNLIHSTWVSANPDEIYDYDPRTADEMAKKGLWVDPTLAFDFIWQDKGIPVKQTDKTVLRSDPDRRYEILKDMWDRGVKFVTGIDSGMAHVGFGDFAYTPQVMVEKAGFPVMDTLVSSTKTTADCLGVLDETGTLEPGKAADAIIVNGDPLKNIRVLHKVDTVVARGKVVKQGGKALV